MIVSFGMLRPRPELAMGSRTGSTNMDRGTSGHEAPHQLLLARAVPPALPAVDRGATSVRPLRNGLRGRPSESAQDSRYHKGFAKPILDGSDEKESAKALLRAEVSLEAEQPDRMRGSAQQPPRSRASEAAVGSRFSTRGPRRHVFPDGARRERYDRLRKPEGHAVDERHAEALVLGRRSRTPMRRHTLAREAAW
jgi:hypothetical protein